MTAADDDIRAPHLRDRDFLGAFAVIERRQRILMVQNERHIGGAAVATWDLPGGQVEPAELLIEALARELGEETGLRIAGTPRFLFLQEGERRTRSLRLFAWRSFFFACDVDGELRAGGEVLAARWFRRDELAAVLHAPYHDSFQRWLQGGGPFHASSWTD